MKKQLIMTVSAEFQAFMLGTCAKHIGPAKSKDEGKALTQSEFSDALLALVTGPQLYMEIEGIDPDTGEETTLIHPVGLDDHIAEVLSARDMTPGQREGARAKLTAAEEKLAANAKALEACMNMLKSMGKTDDEITAFLKAQGLTE